MVMISKNNNNNDNISDSITIENISSILCNLKLSKPSNEQQQQQTSSDYFQLSKSKFKIIKIFLAYNKHEFDVECEFLLLETRQELQEYFLQYGYSLQFIDLNLNVSYNPIIDPKFYQFVLKEIDDCLQYSDLCVFLLFLGYKYGESLLPYEIEQAEYTLVRTTCAQMYLDVTLLDTWYQFDDQSNPSVYRLKPISDVFSNFYNRSKDTYESHQDEIEIWSNTYKNLLDIFQQVADQNNNNNNNNNNSIKSKQQPNKSNTSTDRYHLSYLELLTQYVLKKTCNYNEILVIERKFEGLNENSKNFEKYVDIKYDKIDKTKQERLNKLRELIATKVNDTNIHCFTLKWTNDLFESSYTANSRVDISESTGPSCDLNKNEELNSYLQSLHVIICNKIKFLLERKQAEESSYGLNKKQIQIVEEITRHLYYYHKLNEQNLFGLDESLERLKKLISFGVKNEHFPIFICGQVGTGKTVTLTKFFEAAYAIIGAKNCLCVVRYSDFTVQSSSFETLLFSICEQLALMQRINILNEIKTKEISELIRFFQFICTQISTKSGKNLLVLIDGIQDALIDKTMINNQMLNDHLTWLFNKLPCKIHLIVSIRQQTNMKLLNESLDSLCMSQANSTLVSSNAISLISHLYETKISSQKNSNKENYLFELPFKSTCDTKELTVFIRNEMCTYERYLTDEQLESVIDQVKLQSYSCLYLNLLLKTLGTNRNLKALFTHINGLKDIDSIIKYKIRNLENTFNYKLVYLIANYLNASHNGLTEMELIDVLSCNNEFFFEYYYYLNFPKHLRFPQMIWIYFKNEFSDLLNAKLNDNQITYSWSYDCIRKIMKQTYFYRVENIRSFHKDLANYFLESFVETKPLVDMRKNVQLRDEDGKRYISQQPLVYSELVYNYRRLNESWFHFMNSGDIQRLKEDAFFNFEYLLSRIHGTSLLSLLNDMDLVLKRILDIDIYLLYSLLQKSLTTLTQDPLRLASEILSSIQPLQNVYGTFVKYLVAQAIYWCENYSSPVIIPLTAWLESPESLLITKITNQEGINKVAVTSFNQHVFFSTLKNEIFMYHVPSKRLVKKFIGHTQLITSLLISHSNRFLVSSSLDCMVKVWNLGTGEIDHVLTHNKSPILTCIISHSDDILITGSQDNLISVIRIDTGEIIQTFGAHENAITSLSLSKCDTILVSASMDKTLKRWCLSDMELKDNIKSLSSPVTKMIITCDNVFIIAACEDYKIHLKSLITGTHIHELNSHNSQVNCLVASSDCEHLYVGCEDAKLYLYNYKLNQLLTMIINQNVKTNDLAISVDNSYLFSSSGNMLYVVNLKKPISFIMNDDEKRNYEIEKPINCFALSQEGDLAITGDELGKIKLWNLVDGIIIETIMTHSKEATCVKLSNSYLFSISASRDCTIKVFDNEQNEKVCEFNEHKAPIRHLFILEGNEKILSADEDYNIKVWYAYTGQLIDSISGVACTILMCSPDGKYVVSGSGDNVCKVWLLNDAKVVRQIDHPKKITQVIFTLDSNFIITGGEDNSCKIWESSTGKLIQVLIEHDDSITTIAVSHTNSYVVTGSKDKQVLLWNLKDGHVIGRMCMHKDEIVKVTMAFDSSLIFTASRDGVINVWSTIGAHLLSGIDLHCGIHDILVASSGNRIIVRLINSSSMPILGFNNKLFKNIDDTSLSIMNLKISETLNTANQVLPIKPKKSFHQKQKTVFKILQTQSTEHQQHQNNLISKEELTEILSTNTTKQQQSQSHGIKDFFKKKRIKHERKSGDYSSSNNNFIQHGDKKPKKTKICCLL